MFASGGSRNFTLAVTNVYSKILVPIFQMEGSTFSPCGCFTQSEAPRVSRVARVSRSRATQIFRRQEMHPRPCQIPSKPIVTKTVQNKRVSKNMLCGDCKEGDPGRCACPGQSINRNLIFTTTGADFPIIFLMLLTMPLPCMAGAWIHILESRYVHCLTLKSHECNQPNCRMP